MEAVHTGGRKVVLRWSKPFTGNSPIIKYILQYVEGKGMIFISFYNTLIVLLNVK